RMTRGQNTAAPANGGGPGRGVGTEQKPPGLPAISWPAVHHVGGPPRTPHARRETGTRRLTVPRRASRLRLGPGRSPRGGGGGLSLILSDFSPLPDNCSGSEANDDPGSHDAAGGGGLMFRPGAFARAGRPSPEPDRGGRPVPARFLTPGLAVALAALVGGAVYLGGRPPTAAAPRAELHGPAGVIRALAFSPDGR